MSLLVLVLCALCTTGCGDDTGNDTHSQTEDVAADTADVADTSADFDADARSGADADAGGDATDVGSDTTDVHSDADGGVPTWSGEVWPIFENYGCSSGYCHGGGAGGLDWGSADATYDELVGVVSSSDDGCSDLMRVAPSDSANSLLYQKLAGTQSCGAKMPQGSEITSAELDVVRAWIEAGALR